MLESKILSVKIAKAITLGHTLRNAVVICNNQSFS